MQHKRHYLNYVFLYNWSKTRKSQRCNQGANNNSEWPTGIHLEFYKGRQPPAFSLYILSKDGKKLIALQSLIDLEKTSRNEGKVLDIKISLFKFSKKNQALLTDCRGRKVKNGTYWLLTSLLYGNYILHLKFKCLF